MRTTILLLTVLAGCGPQPNPTVTPAGSYTQSCRSILVDGARLVSECRTNAGAWAESALDGFSECTGDILNDDGRLWCKKPVLAPGPERVPLVMFIRRWDKPQTAPALLIDIDYYTTANPQWTCLAFGECASVPDPEYRLVGIIGYIFNPNRPQPAGTVPLFNWWSETLNDHYLSSDPQSWREGYVFTGIEGYINTGPAPDSTELVTFYNGQLADNATLNPLTFHNQFATGYSSAHFTGQYVQVRVEGHVVGPGTPAGKKCASHAIPLVTGGPYPGDWSKGGRWPRNYGSTMMRGDALSVTGSGTYWSAGARQFLDGAERFDEHGFSMAGIAPLGWPLPDTSKFALIGGISDGRLWVAKWGNVEAGSFFPIGGASHCVEHTSDTVSGELVLSVNDPNLADNAGIPASDDGSVVSIKLWR